MSHEECWEPENETPERALSLALEAIIAVHKAFGAPGDYGYGTSQGQALQHLYAAGELASRTKKKAAEAAS